jgi:D-alanine-D-alanine ligase
MSEFNINFNQKSIIYPQIGSTENEALHVALVYGGMSAEREPSLMSGKVVCDAMSKMTYRVTPIDMGSDIAQILQQIKPDVVFNALHGTFGEDGAFQGMLEILGIPYTNSGVLASALALDKVFSQQILVANGILCPKRIIINKGDDLSIEPIPKPYVIKPIDQGSSLGVEVIFPEDDYHLSNYEFPYGDSAILEEYISGQEIQVAILNKKAVGTLEIICLQDKRFNDYDCKYKPGFSKHICPANLSLEASASIMAEAEKIHKLLGCKGLSRAEFIYDPKQDKAYFIELNTHPGLTLLSSAPEIMANNGINFENFIEILINEAIGK